MKGKFGNYFELDIKDDETEEFFKSLGEQLKTLAGAYLDEKPWKLKSPIIEYGIFGMRTKSPRTKPPGQNPPDKIPLDKITPRTKSPKDKIPLDKIPPVYFIFY